MPCNDKPTNCAPCQDCAPSGDPVLPRCQDVVLPAGTYRNATVVVNTQGCISAVQAGEADLYTPDPCCAPVGGGGTGGPGLPGPPGPAGAAASVEVGTVSTGAPGSAASVTNTGTASAAVFNFVIPRGQPGQDGTVEGGIDLNGPGLVFDGGVLTSTTPSWPPVMNVATTAQPVGFLLSADKNPTSGQLTLTLDATSYDIALRAALQGQFDAQQAQIDSLIEQLSAAQAQIAALTTRANGVDVQLEDITDRLDTCCPPAP